jgi:hypothetical protein
VDSVGIWWEVERILNDPKVLAKSIFVMPPDHKRDWERIASRIRDSFGIEFPAAVDEGLLFAIDRHGRIRTLGGLNNTNLESTRHVLEYLLAMINWSELRKLEVSICKKFRYVTNDDWFNDPGRYDW